MTVPEIRVRSAWVGDVPAIAALLEHYAQRQIVLPRSRTDLYCHLANFAVAVDNAGEVTGCCALRDFGGDLLEVRSLVVSEACQGQGVGRALLHFLIETTRRQRPQGCRIFTLTCQPGFFVKLGFSIVDKTAFPEKIWSDCSICPKAACCDEVALLLNL